MGRESIPKLVEDIKIGDGKMRCKYYHLPDSIINPDLALTKEKPVLARPTDIQNLSRRKQKLIGDFVFHRRKSDKCSNSRLFQCPRRLRKLIWIIVDQRRIRADHLYTNI